jgi:hypothetical protein
MIRSAGLGGAFQERLQLGGSLLPVGHAFGEKRIKVVLLVGELV